MAAGRDRFRRRRAGRRARPRHRRLVADLVARRAGPGRPWLACDRASISAGTGGALPSTGSRRRSPSRRISPSRWRRIGVAPVDLLVGHSLGAAVCMELVAGRPGSPGGWWPRIRPARTGAAMPNYQAHSRAGGRAPRGRTRNRRCAASWHRIRPGSRRTLARTSRAGRLCDSRGSSRRCAAGPGLRVVELAPKLGGSHALRACRRAAIRDRPAAAALVDALPAGTRASSRWTPATRCTAIDSMPTCRRCCRVGRTMTEPMSSPHPARRPWPAGRPCNERVGGHRLYGRPRHRWRRRRRRRARRCTGDA